MIALVAALCAALLSTAEVVSTDAQRLVQHGDAQLAAGDPGGAAESYRKAIEAAPNAFEPRVNLGAALVELGDVDGAIDALEAARKLKPDNPQLLRNLGRAYMAKERWDDAAAMLAKAKAADPHDEVGVKLLGIALGRAGKHDEAIGLLRSAAKKRPADAELLIELASAEIDAHDRAAPATLAKARKAAGSGREGARLKNEIGLLLRQLGDTKQALALFREAALSDPHYAAAVGNLGMALAEAGEWARARGTLETASRLDPDPQLRYFLGQAKLMTGDAKGAIADLENARQWGYDPRAIADMLSRCYDAIGDQKQADAERTRAGPAAGMRAQAADAKAGFDLLQKQDYPGAIAKLERAVKADPNDGASQFNLGLSHLRLGDADAAIEPLRKAAAIVGDQDVVWYALAQAYLKAGDKPHAAGAFTEMLQKFPQRTDVAAQLGHLLLEMEQDATAADRLEEAAKALPNDPSVQYDLAVAQIRLHHAADAVAPLKQYLAKRPGDLDAREAYANALLETGDPHAAAREFETLAAKSPSIARHAVNAAIAWRQAGNTAKERAWLEKASALVPFDAGVWNDLGRLQFQARDWSGAEASFRRAATLDPSNKDAAANAETAAKNAEIEHTKSVSLHLSVIVVKGKADADRLAKKLAKGAKFATLAKASSVHESAPNGGDLGWVDPATLPEWAQPAKSLKPGERSAVLPLGGDQFAIFLRNTD